MNDVVHKWWDAHGGSFDESFGDNAYCKIHVSWCIDFIQFLHALVHGMDQERVVSSS